MRTHPLIAVLPVVILFASDGLKATAQNPREASVEIVVFDTTGSLLPEARVEQFLDAKGRNFASQFRNQRATNIPFGDYRLGVVLQGAQGVERTVTVSQPETAVFIELQLGWIGDFAGPDPPTKIVETCLASRRHS